MSPSKSRTRSKDNSSARAAKDQQKTKPASSTNNGNGHAANAHNPVSGTFHSLEPLSVASSPPLHDNGRSRNADKSDEHSSSPHGTLSEYDSISNNGSCSGESEDTKEKIASANPQQEFIPGSDNDRREKIRLRNERKHQRQKERRAQELHDRCSGYLMSRKLESLSQQLVAMGFSLERSTQALIINEGKLEESISWLFEGNEEAHEVDISNVGSGSNLKIDISEELARISEMEVSYNCSKQEVERVVVASEGDLEKAEDTLKAQKQESAASQSQPEQQAKNVMKPQEFEAASISAQHLNKRDLNYPKIAATSSMYRDPGSRNLQSLHTSNSSLLIEKRWATAGPSPSTSSALPLSMHMVPPEKLEAHAGFIMNEGRTIQQGAGREPIVMIQRPQSTVSKQIPFSSVNALPSTTTGWYVNTLPAVDSVRSNGKLLQNQSMGSMGAESLEQFNHHAPSKEYPCMFGPVESTTAGLGDFWNSMSSSAPSRAVPPELQSTWNAISPPTSHTVAPSLGLFSGRNSVGTYGSSSHVDWNTGGLMPEFDYTNIDWTLNYPPTSKSNGLWLGLSSLLRNNSAMGMSNGNGTGMLGLQNGSLASETLSTTSSGLREWTSPFAGKDIFSVPRHYVTSPSL